MDRESVLRIIENFRQALERKKIKVQTIILYGSCAREDYKEGSDIDLIVISQSFSKIGYWERIEIITDVIVELYEPIEAIAMSPEDWADGDSMFVEYAKNGKVFDYEEGK